MHVHLKKTKDIIEITAHQHRKTRENSSLTIVNIYVPIKSRENTLLMRVKTFASEGYSSLRVDLFRTEPSSKFKLGLRNDYPAEDTQNCNLFLTFFPLFKRKTVCKHSQPSMHLGVAPDYKKYQLTVLQKEIHVRYLKLDELENLDPGPLYNAVVAH